MLLILLQVGLLYKSCITVGGCVENWIYTLYIAVLEICCSQIKRGRGKRRRREEEEVAGRGGGKKKEGMWGLVELVSEMEVDYGGLEEDMLDGDDEGLVGVENVGCIFL